MRGGWVLGVVFEMVGFSEVDVLFVLVFCLAFFCGVRFGSTRGGVSLPVWSFLVRALCCLLFSVVCFCDRFWEWSLRWLVFVGLVLFVVVVLFCLLVLFGRGLV